MRYHEVTYRVVSTPDWKPTYPTVREVRSGSDHLDTQRAQSPRAVDPLREKSLVHSRERRKKEKSEDATPQWRRRLDG